MNLSLLDLVIAGVISFAISIALGPFLIRYLRRIKAGSTIQEELPQTHQGKAGTPVMGGIIFLIPVLLVALWIIMSRSFDSRVILGVLIYTYGLGTIGFMDDYLKVVKKRSLGLKAREKLLGQTLVAVVFLAVFLGTRFDTSLTLPFLGYSVDIGYLYIPFMIVMAMATSNAVNLTDGMDGLLSGCMVFSMLSYMFVSLVVGKPSISLIAASFIGALLAFLRFNFHPAKVFMGDTGSLALGGALTSFAVLTKTELLLIVIGGLYVIEALSVIIQVAYFKLTKGKRVFKMSPIHYHFHLSGWNEVKVVLTFWLVSGLLGLIGLLGLANMS